jgi:hypothetical protein
MQFDFRYAIWQLDLNLRLESEILKELTPKFVVAQEIYVIIKTILLLHT